ncbi:MAG: hypothetical protein JO092_00680 [Candidatus Eremiobacteraeota bacterium]|nr:hypothetical protein [Candidatus Eremiobacteraeota bacterium]
MRTLRLAYEMNAALVLTGFDSEGFPHILSCTGFDDAVHTRHVPANHDTVGYFGIGTGSAGALWMMKYKAVGPNMPYRDVAYYAVEGKYYGELGNPADESTNLVVIRRRKKTLFVDPRWVDKIYLPLSLKLRPRKLREKNRKKLRKLKYEKR